MSQMLSCFIFISLFFIMYWWFIVVFVVVEAGIDLNFDNDQQNEENGTYDELEDFKNQPAQLDDKATEDEQSMTFHLINIFLQVKWFLSDGR